MLFHRPVLLLATGLMLLFSASTTLAGDAKVSGTVTYQGKPIAAGKITFHLDGGQFVGAKVKDGKYTVSRVPSGTCRVTVDGKDIPAKYAIDGMTPLTVEVKEGTATFDFSLQ